MRIPVLIAAVIFALSPVAFADSFSMSTSGTLSLTLISPDDDYWAVYSTTAPRSAHVNFRNATTTLPDFSFALPSGSTITSATISLILPTTDTVGTTTGVIRGGLPKPNPSDPVSIAPTFGSGTINVAGTDFRQISFGAGTCPAFGHGGVFNLCGATITDGNDVSTGTLDLGLVFDPLGVTLIDPTSPGYNWEGYVDATGTVVLPYTVEVDGTFTPAVTPEPSSLVLLGTAMLAGAGVVSRRRFAGGISAV